MSAIEHELVEKISHLDEEQQRQVLDFIQNMGPSGNQAGAKTYYVLELLKLPPAERDRLIAESFAASADEDFETFEAYSEEDLDAIP